MKYIFMALIIFLVSGCATWSGVKQDTKTGANWTKEKVHKGATYIEKKTE